MRVSYKLNLNGPSLFVYTTCSTSLVAIHLGYQALLNGECDIALAGGITVVRLAKTGYIYEEGMIQSPDGHCRAFDAAAKGLVGADGAGVVILKRLRDAVSEGDHIYAVIKGSAINNDGMQKAGFTAPSVKGQAEVIKMAMQMAGVEPESIGYVETHGTGTELGDPVEIEGLKRAYNTTKKGFCGIGSVKTNLGHVDCAAGIAGFIKTILAINHRLIPPSLHFEIPNPGINFVDSPFYVNTWPTPWESDGQPLRAGVSAFGQGGTNAHVILEEFRGNNPHEPLTGKTDEKEYQIIILSARTPTALDKIIINLAHYLKENPHTHPADVAYTLQVGRHNFKYRKMFVCASIPGAIEILDTQSPHKIHSFTVQEENRPVVFIFPGKEVKEAEESNSLANWLIACGIKPYAVIGNDNQEMSTGQGDTLAPKLKELAKLENPIFIYFGSDIENIEKILADSGYFSGHIVPMLNFTQVENQELYFLTNQLGRLWLYGINIDWESYHAGARRYRIPLPTYPFEGQRYWIDEASGQLTVSTKDTSHVKAQKKSGSTLYPRPELSCVYIPPAGEIEIKLATIWQEFFGFEQIGSQDDFFELGGDSLKVINMVTRLQKELEVLIPISEFFNRSTIRGLAEYILANPQKTDWIPIEPAEKREYYPLALTQRRIYILQQVDPENISYNIPDVYQLNMKVDIVKFEDIFKEMIRRQENFRTSFSIANGEPIQRIHPEVDIDFAIEYYEVTGKDKESIIKSIKNFVRPFDLSRPPLLRVGLIKIAEEKYLLATDMHHLISDGISIIITIRDFLSLYNDNKAELPELPIQYKDFTIWQLKEKEKGALKKQEEYWLKEFEGPIPELRLPLDYTRPTVQSFIGNSIIFVVESYYFQELKTIAEHENVTLFMVLLAIYNVLLSRLSGQEQIIVGTGVAGRNHDELINLVGTFINTIPLKSFPIKEKTFKKLLNEIREKILLAFANQDYPFEELVEKVVPNRDRSRNPLFDVFLMSLAMDRSSLGSSSGTNTTVPPRYEYDSGVSKFDLGLLYWEYEGNLMFMFEYCSHLFKKETIERFIIFFKDIISAVTKNKNITLAEIEITHALLTAREDVIPEDSDDFEF